ncbi:hypothetical protein [Bacillus paramycoides]|nr:hypothetical protein [Bacillus paramycoides]
MHIWTLTNWQKHYDINASNLRIFQYSSINNFMDSRAVKAE